MRRGLVLLIVSLFLLVLLTWGRIELLRHLHDQGFFAKYVELADRILAGQMPRDRIGDVSPGYLWLMVAFRRIGMTLAAIRDTQVVALSVAALFCSLAAKRLGGWVAAIAAALLVLGSRAALVTATELEPETLILMINGAALLLIMRWWSSDRPAWLWPAGLLMGISAIARPTALATIALLVLLAVIRSWRAAAGFLAAALLPIVIVLLVNRSLTGDLSIMRPGTHVYDGNNPLATGCAGVLPRIVADLNAQSTQPDFLHVAYRMVEARATHTPIDAKRSSRYWSGKAYAFMRAYPSAALRLFAWKAVLTVHHYDIYDLMTTKRKADELSRYPAIPFGTAFVLSIAALVLRKRRSDLLPALAFAAATLFALVAFNVSSRQRNPLLVPFSVLGAAGIAEIVALARARDERALYAFAAIAVAVPILGIEGPPMKEDAYNWSSSLRASAMRSAAFATRARGDERTATGFAALASLDDTADPPIVSAVTLRSAALAEARAAGGPETLFDIVIALEKARAWQDAINVASRIEHYTPKRENRAVSSLSFYRARAALHLAAPAAAVRQLLGEAEREAPGDPDVLALRYATGEEDALRRLEALHDPFTRDFVLAHAFIDTGRPDAARAIFLSLENAFPEWRRPAMELAAMPAK